MHFGIDIVTLLLCVLWVQLPEYVCAKDDRISYPCLKQQCVDKLVSEAYSDGEGTS